MCLEKRGMMCWASIFNGRFSGSIKVLKYVLKKYAVRCECHCYSKPVQSIQAIVDSAWSGAARWEQTAWAALAELFPWTAIFVTWISLISITCSWFYKSKQVFHCWAWNFWLCRPNSFPTTFFPLKLFKYCLKLSAELKKWAPETLRACVAWPLYVSPSAPLHFNGSSFSCSRRQPARCLSPGETALFGFSPSCLSLRLMLSPTTGLFSLRLTTPKKPVNICLGVL